MISVRRLRFGLAEAGAGWGSARSATGAGLPAGADGRNPPLPAKIPTLIRLIPHLRRARAVVCAEQTSLWLPRALPFLPPFVKTSHGVGSMSARDDPRRRAGPRSDHVGHDGPPRHGFGHRYRA